MTTQTDCQSGHYCPEGSSSMQACPAGTYNDQPNAESVADCLPCPPGKYCASSGRSSPNGDCQAGYFCIAGSTTATPGDFFPDAGAQASYLASQGWIPSYGVCPVDHYCEAGVGLPAHCGDGKYSNGARYKTGAGQCSLCPAGKYCLASYAGTQPTGDCAVGYYCPEGSTVSNPDATPCPAGKYCPAGASTPTPCPDAEYQPSQKQGSCITCPAGHWCYAAEGASSFTECAPGRYCAASTGSSEGEYCPIGTHSELSARTREKDCLPCPPGFYCDAAGLPTPAGACAAGYFCTIASPSATPNNPSDSSTSLPIAGYQTIYPVSDFGGQCVTG